eukprot:5612111-Pyramimonas_sp.AAC.1
MQRLLFILIWPNRGGWVRTWQVRKLITFPRVLKRIKHFNTLERVRFNVVVKPNPATKTAEACYLTIDLADNTLKIRPTGVYVHLQGGSGDKKVGTSGHQGRRSIRWVEK